MARNYYGDIYGDMDRFRSYQHQPVHYYEERSVPLHLSYAERQPVRSAPTGRPDHSRQEVHDQDQPLNNSTRRRIAVACARCRKRKIKCSGDPGNGFGCQNCRTAGVDSCNFHRVGSLELPTVVQQHQGGALANYMSPPNGDRLQYLNLQQYNYAQSPQSLTIATRGLHFNSYYSADAHQYESDSPADNYVLSPATAVATQDSYGGSYPMHDSSRAWSNPISRYPMSSYHSRYGEQDPASSYSYQTNMQARRPAMSDGSGAFNTSSLQMSLPNPPTERVVLPPPNAGARQQFSSNPYDIMQMRMAGSSTNITIPSYVKPAPNWATDQATSDARSDSVTSTRPGEIAVPVAQKTSKASSTSSDGSSLTFISSNASPDISPTTTTSNQFPPHTAPSQHHGLGVTHTEHPVYSLPAASASETRIPQSGLSGNTYTFSIARRPSSNNDLSSSDDRLINGTPYVPLQSSGESNGRLNTMNSFRHEASEHRSSHLHHRNSMPAISQDS